MKDASHPVEFAPNISWFQCLFVNEIRAQPQHGVTAVLPCASSVLTCSSSAPPTSAGRTVTGARDLRSREGQNCASFWALKNQEDFRVMKTCAGRPSCRPAVVQESSLRLGEGEAGILWSAEAAGGDRVGDVSTRTLTLRTPSTISRPPSAIGQSCPVTTGFSR